MKFSIERQAKIAGLLTEADSRGSIHEYAEDKVDEADEMDEADKANEMDEMDEVDEADEMDEGTVIESADIRRIIRNEIKRSLANRDPNAVRYTSGQVFGKKAPRTLGEVVFGFPGIGFKR